MEDILDWKENETGEVELLVSNGEVLNKLGNLWTNFSPMSRKRYSSTCVTMPATIPALSKNIKGCGISRYQTSLWGPCVLQLMLVDVDVDVVVANRVVADVAAGKQ